MTFNLDRSMLPTLKQSVAQQRHTCASHESYLPKQGSDAHVSMVSSEKLRNLILSYGQRVATYGSATHNKTPQECGAVAVIMSKDEGSALKGLAASKITVQAMAKVTLIGECIKQEHTDPYQTVGTIVLRLGSAIGEQLKKYFLREYYSPPSFLFS